MTRIAGVADIRDLYAARGGLTYGEGVTQIEHAVQCATLAQENGAADTVIVAALLHDIGHLLADPADPALDDRHEAKGAAMLHALFGDAVSRPVALHVAAKRYLCRIEPGYAAALSDASRLSLAVQGGAFDRQAADMFARLPHATDAVALRRFDDQGKRDDTPPRAFEDFLPLVDRCAADAGRESRGRSRAALPGDRDVTPRRSQP